MSPASRPVVFGRRDRASGPQWASGTRIEAADLPHAGRGLVRPRDFVEVGLPGDRWEEFRPSNEAFTLLRGARVVWSVPLVVQRTPLEEIASGRHDEDWASLGRLVAGGPSPVVRIVLPEDADPAQVRAAFRHAASAIRRTPGVAIEWGVPRADPPATWESAWPGDDVVDIVGVPTADGPSWVGEVAAPGGLADWSSWSRSHRRRLAVHWTLEDTVDGGRVERVADWLDMAARTSILAYDSVDATSQTRADALAAYRDIW